MPGRPAALTAGGPPRVGSLAIVSRRNAVAAVLTAAGVVAGAVGGFLLSVGAGLIVVGALLTVVGLALGWGDELPPPAGGR